MHEMGLVRDVVDVVLDVAQQAGAERVTVVHLTIGYARDVVEDLVQGLFQYLARDTVAADAKLELTRVPITVRCNRCGTVFPISMYKKDTWVCPSCATALDYEMQTGKEFFISDIEITMPKVASPA